MTGQQASTAEQRHALETRAIIGSVAPRGAISVTGVDRANYLHGLLTNDITALAPGQGCYAAWLTPQGRMMTDLFVLELGDSILLDAPADLAAAILQRLDEFVFSEDVQLADASAALAPLSIHGPSAAALLRRVLGMETDLGAWARYQNARATFDGSPLVVARIDQLGVPGFCVYSDRPAVLGRALETAGAIPASPDVIEAARIEAGYPVFGLDLTHETIPLEAGIEDRAISFTKGCYVGQEVIVRVLHRGHGRVARRLVGLTVEGSVPARGARILSANREIGHVTSAASSPRLGVIALGYVHRDFSAPGSAVEIDTPPGRWPAAVSDLPFSRSRPA